MIDYEKLLHWRFPKLEQRLTPRDTMLYALGIGFGADPIDPAQLRYVYEKNLRAFPSIATMLCYPGNWLKDPETGVDFIRVLNAGTKFVIHSPLPVEGNLESVPRVTHIVDKGVGKGAIIQVERDVLDAESGKRLCSIITRTFCRSDGGFGGPSAELDAPLAVPDTAPQKSVEIPTAENLALIHRLSGDYNPLHAGPEIARAAGYQRPILHGFCTLGIAARSLVDALAGGDSDSLASMDVRFTSPVIPGETIRTDIWRDGPVARFRVVVPSRGVTVLDRGWAEFREG